MKRPSIIAVVENGETRCGLTEEITGLGSLPYRLTRSCPEGWEKPQNVFQSMEEVLTEVSLEQYQAYLDHPEEADDHNAMIEIDVDHDVIRIDEDTGMEREYHEYPLGQFVSRAWTLRERRRDCGNDWFASYKVYLAMKPIEISRQEYNTRGMDLGQSL